MSTFWKTLTTTDLRVYFRVVSGGNLVTGLSPNVFTALLINPTDTSSSGSTVTQSTQKPGVYYTDLDSSFLINNGVGMYGLSIGIHKPSPNRIDDEVLFSIEVTDGDLAVLNTKLNELWQIHGLDESNPMTVSKTGRLVDTIDQTFEELGGTTVKVTRQP